MSRILSEGLRTVRKRGLLNRMVRSAFVDSSLGRTIADRTDFEKRDFDLNQLIDLVEQTDPEDLESSGKALWDARDAIKAAADELEGHIDNVHWVGESGDAFRKWGSSLVTNTHHLSDFAGSAGDQITAAAVGLASVRGAMPSRDSEASRKRPEHFTEAEKAADKSEYAAAVRVEKDRQEAINQMNRLASYYAVSEEVLASLPAKDKTPEFTAMPDVGVPRPAKEYRPGGSASGANGESGTATVRGPSRYRDGRCHSAWRKRRPQVHKGHHRQDHVPRRARPNQYRQRRHAATVHDHTRDRSHSAGMGYPCSGWRTVGHVRGRPRDAGLQRHIRPEPGRNRWSSYPCVGSGAHWSARLDQFRSWALDGARTCEPDGACHLDRPAHCQRLGSRIAFVPDGPSRHWWCGAGWRHGCSADEQRSRDRSWSGQRSCRGTAQGRRRCFCARRCQDSSRDGRRRSGSGQLTAPYWSSRAAWRFRSARVHGEVECKRDAPLWWRGGIRGCHGQAEPHATPLREPSATA